MQTSEHPSSFKKYMEILKKIKIIRNKDKYRANSIEDAEHINHLIADVNDFVSQYIKGRSRANLSFADFSDKIDYDMRILLANLSDSWKEDVLYLRDNLRRAARAQNSDITSSNFSARLLFITIFVLTVFIGVRIKMQIDTSYDISTIPGIENAIRIHKKQRNYDKYVTHMEEIPYNLEDWFRWILWPVKPTEREALYYEQYIKLNLDIMNYLIDSGHICSNYRNYDDLKPADRKKLIEFMDVPSEYITKHIKETIALSSDKKYYEAVVKAYTDSFPCKNKWGADFPIAR